MYQGKVALGIWIVSTAIPVLLGKKLVHDLAPGPTVLSKAWRRPGKDHQCARKRVRPGTREEESAIEAANLDRPDVDRKRILLE
ncbi:hypothetical protein ACROYT_G002812 [Oculina patagonica]